MANRFLNNITINDAYTFPTADGTEGQVITTDGSGTLSFADAAASDAIVLTVKNISGGSLSKGTVVHPSPSASPPSGNILEVIAADKSAASTMPAIGVLNETLADDGEGECIAFGSVTGIDTSSFSASDPIYVGASGGFTTTKPSGTDLIQKIGIVVKVHASNGSIKVFGANRTNDVPAPLYVDIPNERLGVGVTSPSYTLDVRSATNSPMQIRSNTGVTRFRLRNSSTTSMIGAEGDDFIFYPDNAERMRITGDGKVGIGQSTPEVSLDISATDAVQMPSGTTAQRPTGEAGMFRYNSEEGQFEGYTTEWGAIAGGGGGTVTVEKNVYTGNNSTVNFNTSTSIADENNVQVYIDGVYQSKDNYTTSGSTVTFSTAPPSNTSIELIHMVAVSGVVARDSFTGDASTVAYVLSMSITNENNTQVYIDGVYQSKDNYSVSGSTLTFSTAPPNGSQIEVVHIKAVDASTLNQNSFTGDGSTTDFTLSQSIDDENKTFVFVQGVYQEKSTYSISGTTLTFTTAPQNGYTVEVMAFNSITIGNQGVTSFNGQTGAITGVNSVNGQTGAVTIQEKYDTVNVISTNTTAVANRLYVLTANLTLTLPASPNTGDSIKISNRSGVATALIARNGNKIMGDASDLTIDKLNAGFEMIYSGSAQGWVLIGVPGQ